MSKPNYIKEGLKKFGKLAELQKELADRFFNWYDAVFEEGPLAQCEKITNYFIRLICFRKNKILSVS